MLDLDDLLRSLSDEAPSGPDLEYDPEYIELSLTNLPGEERVVGDAVIAAEPPDYPAVEQGAVTLLSRSRDLRVAVVLANAALRTKGLPGFEEALHYIRRSLEEYWETLHPQLDAEDDDDPTMRINAIRGLTDRETVLASLRLAALTNSRGLGRFSLRDLQIADGEFPAQNETEKAATPQAISAAFQDSDPAYLEATVEAVGACLDHVRAITTILDERVGTFGPDLDPLLAMLRDIKRRVSPHVVTIESDAAEDPAIDKDDPKPSAASAIRPGFTGAGIHSPEDVKTAIDRIIEYYARNEPSSPIPLLLNRARRLVSADFFTIMRDLAPQGVENVALIGGIDADE